MEITFMNKDQRSQAAFALKSHTHTATPKVHAFYNLLNADNAKQNALPGSHTDPVRWLWRWWLPLCKILQMGLEVQWFVEFSICPSSSSEFCVRGKLQLLPDPLRVHHLLDIVIIITPTNLWQAEQHKQHNFTSTKLNSIISHLSRFKIKDTLKSDNSSFCYPYILVGYKLSPPSDGRNHLN